MEKDEILHFNAQFDDIRLQLNDMIKLINEKPKNLYQSEQIDQLMGALALAQGEMEDALRSGFNNHIKYNYADINDILRVARPVLSKNKIAVTQKILLSDEGGEILETQLTHASGQWTKSVCRINPPTADIQKYGGYVTYLKRYSLQALVGIACADDDDDGESNMQEARTEFIKGTAVNHNYDKDQEKFEVITKAEREELEYELKGYADLYKEILKTYKLTDLANLPRARYRYVIEQARRIKNSRETKQQ